MSDSIPDIVVGRLPVYLRALTHLADEGEKTTTSSHELGQRLGISSAQIRKDLSHFGEFGKQGTGYHIDYLIGELRRILNLKQVWPVAIVGAGNLGHALANFQGFQDRGFRIAWLFDGNPHLVGEEIRGVTVQHTDEMEATLEREGTKIAILAIPAAAAQEITDRLVSCGVRSILNYAPINLKVPEGVQVRYSDPVVQLQRMTFYLERAEEASP